MGLISLSLRDFRCFSQADLTFSPEINLIWGANASGKTSILEAVFLLSRGRSFRASHLDPVSRYGTPGFQVVGQATAAAGKTTIGLRREKGSLIARIAGRTATSLAQLAEALPVQLLDNQAHLLVDGSPRHRRQFLDWGVFHVEPGFFAVWRRYQRALQQRNALLRKARPVREISAWDAEIASSGEQLDKFRRDYLGLLSKTAEQWAQTALGGLPTTLEYRSGWAEDRTLLEALIANQQRDRQQGATQSGPHRADVLIKVAGHPARERISRGQEKALAGTLLLAQSAVYRAVTSRTCVLLLDDLPSELDPEYLDRFVQQIGMTGAQTLITAIKPEDLPSSIHATVFHVEQGKIAQML